MSEKSAVRFDDDLQEARPGEEFLIPVRSVSAVEMIRFLMNPRAQRRGQKQFAARFEDARDFLDDFDRLWHMLEHR